MRPVCKKCGIRPRAVNYKTADRTYYRSLCEGCVREKNNIKKTQQPAWKRAGYKKKPTCERCGFKPVYDEQLQVYYIDNKFTSISRNNLRTVCLNCNYELGITGWRTGDLEED